MQEIKLSGTVVGTSSGVAKASGNPYQMVTVLIGGEPMTLMVSRQGGVVPTIEPGKFRETTLVLGLTAFRTEPRLDFIRAE